MSVLHSMRKQARRIGLEVRRADYRSIEIVRLVKQLHTNRCDVVLDVGANTGQFAAELFDEGGYEGEVISFEPLPDAHEQLRANAAARAARGVKWRVAPCSAVGAANGMAIFHISENSVSSSLARIADAHLDAAPSTRVTADIEVEVRTLHTLLSELGIDASRMFLKMDTQGTEDAVLEGALPVMDRVAGIKIELSALELYWGQKLYPEMDKIVRDLGFGLWDVVAGARNPSSLQMLQYDGIYFRASAAAPPK